MMTDKQLQDLRANVACPVLDESHIDFDVARRVWNGMIDRKPLAIVCCSSISDVSQAVQFARLATYPFQSVAAAIAWRGRRLPKAP